MDRAVTESHDETLALPGLVQARQRAKEAAAGARAPAPKPPLVVADPDPVARVLVHLPLAHLDRPFDYLVPAEMAADAVPGARVKVRFAGQDADGFIVERAGASDHGGRLAPLRRVVSAEPVLTPEVVRLSEQLAERYAGTRSDILRLAIPPRHATTEKNDSGERLPLPMVDGGGWASYSGDVVGRLVNQPPVRAVWSCLPGDDWADLMARAAIAGAQDGRTSLICVPDQRDVDRLAAAVTRLAGRGSFVALTSQAGPAKRYSAFLKVSRGVAPIVIGTRAAALAPVRNLGLVAMWDDGDDLFVEPRAPYPHTREILLQRAADTGCSVMLGGFARSAEAEYLVRTGWAEDVSAPREEVRRRVTVAVAGATDHDLVRDPHARTARIPSQVHRAISAGLAEGPVLVQTPRAGYATRLACDRCRTPASCSVCHGPLRLPGAASAPVCAWCATPAPGWTCAVCGGHGLRAPVVGEARTAEEFGRAFPSVAVRRSSADQIADTVPGRPAIVVATTGAEPVAEGGYAAVILLDTWLLLARADLRAEEEAFRRWANAAGLVRPGGKVLAVGDAADPALQALVRWDPAGLAERLIEDRLAAHLPPASRVVTLTATNDDLDEYLDGLLLPPGAEVLGPVRVDDELDRLVLRVPRASGPALSRILGERQRERSAKKLPHVRVEVDPHELG